MHKRSEFYFFLRNAITSRGKNSWEKRPPTLSYAAKSKLKLPNWQVEGDIHLNRKQPPEKRNLSNKSDKYLTSIANPKGIISCRDIETDQIELDKYGKTDIMLDKQNLTACEILAL